MNDADFKKVTESFLVPLCELFGKNLSESQVKAFVEDLAIYTPPELLGASVSIRRSSRYFPTIKDAIEACQKFRDRADAEDISKNGSRANPAIEKNNARVAAIQEYLARFRQSVMWMEAEREGWELFLWRYVYAVADVQLQMMSGLKNIGWNGVDIFGTQESITDDMKKDFFVSQRVQAKNGIVEVGIPTAKIKEWKLMVKK